jgi:hypothetical protein
MAKQAGHHTFTGTLNNLTGRKLNGKYIVQTKSSLDKKRVKTDSRFERSRQSSNRFSLGQRIASDIYNKFFPRKGRYQLFVQLRSEAILMLKAEKDEKEVVKKLSTKVKAILKKETSK